MYHLLSFEPTHSRALRTWGNLSSATTRPRAAGICSTSASSCFGISVNTVYWAATPFTLEALEARVAADGALPRVDIVYSHVDDDGVMVRAAMAAGALAIVHAGTGNGSIHEKTEGALMEAAAHGVLVVRASRTPSGMTVEGLAEWQDAGFVPAGTLNPQKARVLAQLSLACGVDPALAFRTF